MPTARDVLMIGLGALIQPLIAVGGWVVWHHNMRKVR